MPNQFEFYKDKKGEHRWRKLSGSNGLIIGASSEGFSSHQASVKNAQLNGYKGAGKRNVIR